MASTLRTFQCPYCPRLFANIADLHQHMMAKRRVSKAHGVRQDGIRRTRMEIVEAVQNMQKEWGADTLRTRAHDFGVPYVNR